MRFSFQKSETCLVAEDSGNLSARFWRQRWPARYLYHLVCIRIIKDKTWKAPGPASLDALAAQGIQKCHIFVLVIIREGLKFWQKYRLELREDT